MRRIEILTVVLTVLMGAVTVTTPAATLRLSERIEAQRRVEAVYWAHRVWPAENQTPKPALSDVLDEATLAARAEEGLRKSEILSRRFHIRIDAAMLWTEVQRMARESREPGLLQELFNALNNDGALIAEVLARPILADRLLQEAYLEAVPPDASGKRTLSFDAWWDQETSSSSSMLGASGLDEASAGFGAAPGITAGGCSDNTWTPFGLTSPSRRYHQVNVWTGSEMLMWGGMGEGTADAPLDAWRYNPATDAWTRMAADPDPLRDQNDSPSVTGVWTGTEMIVIGWNGNGRRYNPATNSWRSMTQGPVGYDNSTPAVWTGSRMLVWDVGSVAGGLYDPVADSWTYINSDGAPSPRINAMTIWTGTKFIVWGGYSFDISDDVNDGARYDLATDTWTPMTTDGAPFPAEFASIVWTGTEVVIWGSNTGNGGRYNPATDSWRSMSPVNQPFFQRQEAYAVYGNGRVIIWGGRKFDGTNLGDGGRYDVASDTWLPITATNAPEARYNTMPVWTGTEMIVWGGSGSPYQLDTGARYNPNTDKWTPMFRQVRPLYRTSQNTVWTGTEMLLWGGFDPSGSAQGYAYNTATDSWRLLPVSGAPDGRDEVSAVWTGLEMLVWGGCCVPETAIPYNSGGRYNPTTDTWASMTQSGAPSARHFHTAAWTGSQMLVWGGSTPEGDTNTGGRYNATTDTWSSMNTAGAPTPRTGFVGVWSGTRLLVWGGYSYSGYFYHNDGARFDPVTDSWTPMSYTGASVRTAAQGVWTGTEMLIWGGLNSFWGGVNYINDGWRYNLATDTWHPMSQANQPYGRVGHTTIWTGSKMVVWGGSENGNTYNDGGRYDPAADTWTPTLQDPTTPANRMGHSAVWTGSEMLIWGGVGIDNGSRYCSGGCTPLTWYRDADGDGIGNASVTQSSCTQPTGYVGVAGDCDDTNSTIWGTPGEVINLNLVRTTGAAAMLTWAPPASPGGTTAGTRYDTLRSTQASDFSATHATCVATGSSTLQTSDATKPAAGTSFYYLVRAMNNCSGGTGVGSLGSTSAGAPRPGRICP